MNTRDQLNHYLRGLETRLRWLTVSKGIAIALGVALGATLAMVWFTNALAFSNTSITIARVGLEPAPLGSSPFPRTGVKPTSWSNLRSA